jgi:hypothetical protein
VGFFRFRRSFKVAPGVRINLSKSGVSTSIGTRRAHVTVGRGQVRETVGLPGSGLSYTEVHSTRSRDEHAREEHTEPPGPLATTWNLTFLAIVLGVVFFVAYWLAS